MGDEPTHKTQREPGPLYTIQYSVFDNLIKLKANTVQRIFLCERMFEPDNGGEYLAGILQADVVSSSYCHSS